LPWGNSDHTSFNEKGYPGIWWFEDINCDCPYIHHTSGSSGCGNNCTGSISCLGDKIGPSVNNPQQVTVFTQAMVASIALLAEFVGEMPPPLYPPTHCVAEYVEDMNIIVTWETPAGNTPDEYYVYKDETKISETAELFYSDTVEDFDEHCYTVTAVYAGVESEHSNISCASVPPRPPLSPPTNCVANWVPEEANINNNIIVTWDAPEENTPDEYFVYRDDEEITKTTDTQFMDALEKAGEYCYKIVAGYPAGQSDFSNESCEAIPHIDGLIVHNSNFLIYPNPTTNELRVTSYGLPIEDIEIFDVYGRKLSSHYLITSSPHHLITSSPHHLINLSHLHAGIYFIKITTQGGEVINKVVKL
jgi:hypothetical protein